MTLYLIHSEFICVTHRGKDTRYMEVRNFQVETNADEASWQEAIQSAPLSLKCFEP